MRKPSHLVTSPTYGSITGTKQLCSQTGKSKAPLKPKQTPSNLVPLKRVCLSQQSNHPSMILTNCQSLTEDKLDELKLIVDERQPDIIMLTESWLTDDKEEARQIPEYNLHTSNRSKRIGGGDVHDTGNSLYSVNPNSFI